MDVHKHVVETLTKLRQLDIDAIFAYERAIQAVDDDAIRAALLRFQGDHERHVERLEAALREWGARPGARRPDAKGLLIEGLTQLRSARGTESALQAMRSNEWLTNETYLAAMTTALPQDVLRLVQSHWADEQRHLHYVGTVLDKRSREQAAMASRQASGQGHGMTIEEASAALAPLPANVLRQGPGGQALELAPTVARKARPNLSLPLKEKVGKRISEAVGDVGRQAAGVAAKAVAPLVRAPVLSSLVGVGALAALGAFLIGRGGEQRRPARAPRRHAPAEAASQHA